ncbi:MAG: hypothetical protein KF690_08465 [Bacteroidetes bacterium]|nr:hypothetical protein [Bacteroidota bacterium]
MRRWVWPLLVLPGLGLLWGLQLWVPQARHPDDSFLFALHQPVKEQGLVRGMLENLERDRLESGRLRPVYIAVLSAYLYLAGPDATAWHLLMTILWIATGVLSYGFWRKLGLPAAVSILLTGALCTGAQAESWQYHLFSEPLAMLCFVGGLRMLVPQAGVHRRWLSGMLLLLAGLSKESFLLCLPAWALLAWHLRVPVGRQRPWPELLVTGAGLGVLAYVRLYMSTTLNDEFGFSLQLFSWQNVGAAATDLLLTSYGAAILLLLAAAWGLFRRQEQGPRYLWLWIGLGIVLPQLLLHSLTGFRAGRYLYPALWGMGLLAVPFWQRVSVRLSCAVAALWAVLSCITFCRHQHNWAQMVIPYTAFVHDLVHAQAPLVLVADAAAANYELTHLYHVLSQAGKEPAIVLLDLYERETASLHALRALSGFLYATRLPLPCTQCTVGIVPHLAGARDEAPLLVKPLREAGYSFTQARRFVCGGTLPVLGQTLSQKQSFLLYTIP